MQWWKLFSAITLGLILTDRLSAQPSASALNQQFQTTGALLHFMLLDQPSVQQELRLTPQQIQQVKDFGNQERARLQGIRQQPNTEATIQQVREAQLATEKTLERVLSAEQMLRLKQIGYQKMGGMALSRTEVADAVGLNEAQRAEVQRLQVEFIQTMQQQIPRGGAGMLRPGAVQEKIAQVKATFEQTRKATSEKALALLSTEQKTKLTEIQGVPFQGEISMQNSSFAGGLQQQGAQGGLGGGLRGRLRNR